MNQQPLSDVRVLDLTRHIAGPYCTKLLADSGADVIKVERAGSGDPARREGPFFGDDPHPEKSGLFLHLNTNKRGISLNLKSDTGKTILKELMREVDILVESFSPRVMPGLELDYHSLDKINPKLVMTSISNFGQSGPYRDFKASELVVSGMGSTMKSAPFSPTIRDDSAAELSMQMVHPIRPTSVSNTGNPSPGRMPDSVSPPTARCTLRYRPSILPSGPISTALL